MGLSVSYTHLDVYKRQGVDRPSYSILLSELIDDARFTSNNTELLKSHIRDMQATTIESVSYTHLDVYKRQGHNGYVGTVLVPMLLKAGHEVVGLDSNLYQAATFGEEDAPAIPAIQRDVRDVTYEDLDGFQAILHLAGLSNDPLGDLNPALTYDINHRASVRMAQMAKELGTERFIFSSSCSNYGAGVDDWLTEESAFNPVTPYGKSKVMVEQDAVSYTHLDVYKRQSSTWPSKTTASAASRTP